MKRSNRRWILAAVLPTLFVVAATWPGGTALRAQLPALSVTPLSAALTPAMLAQDLVGAGVSVSNVEFTGDLRSAGRFSGGGGIIGIGDGIVFSSGKVVDVVGPNVGKGEIPDADATTTSFGTDGDDDMASLLPPPGTTTFDATILEFDFVPTHNQVTLKYVFTSEEFNEWTNSGFTNVFGFFVNGVNYALLPDGTTQVAINTVNGGNPFSCADGSDNDADGLVDAADPDCTTPNDNIVGEDDSNSQHFINNDCSDPDGATTPCAINIEADGLTTVLTFKAPVNAGATNHIRLGIADAGDSILDSWVFIQAGSLVSSPAETCNVDGSPNGIDEDGDGIVDEGCYKQITLQFTPQFPSLVADFAFDSKLGNVRDNSLTLTHMFGVLQEFDVTVRASIEDPATVAFSPDQFGTGTECSLNKLDPFVASEEPCVRYEILTEAMAGAQYGAGNRAVQLKIAFFQPAEQKVNTDPVMGYTHEGTFDQSILDHAIFPPDEDPEGIGYIDEYGSSAIMGVTPRPAEQPTEEACHVDGTPNGIDEDRDGVTDEGCTVARSFDFSPEAPSYTFVFNDLGNVKPNEFGLDHNNGVTAPFNVTVVATIVDPDDVFFGGEFGGGTVCASNNIFSTDPLAQLPCVHYELVGADGAPYNHGDPGTNADGVKFSIRYFAPASQSATHVAGMGYSQACGGTFNDNILFSFERFPGDDADPEGVGYIDEYGSCAIMTATPAPPLALNLPDDITVVAASAAGTAVSFPATATGVVDGVLTTFDATCTPPSGSTFPIGQDMVSCSATDGVQTVSGSFNVNVVYGICALYDTQKPEKAGSTIPIKLNLCAADGSNLSSPDIVLQATSLTYLSGSAEGAPEAPGNSQPNNNFRFTSPSYHFNLKATGLASGKWTLNFTVGGDPTVYSTPFVIK